MALVVNDFLQGTDEWQSARGSIPSASNFGKILTATGKPSTQAKGYMFELISNKYSPEDFNDWTNKWVERGTELEGEARNYYELINDVTVEQVGLVYLNDEKLVCGSPDGLVGDDGGLEIKCYKAEHHMETLLSSKMPTIHIPQVQGYLWITGRKWFDFLAYHPKYKHLQVRIERDDEYISKLQEHVFKFIIEMKELEQKVIRVS